MKAAVSRDIGQDRDVPTDCELGLAILVRDVHDAALSGMRDSADRGVRHRALRHQVPGAMPFSPAPHRFRKDVHLDRAQVTVGLRHRGDADENAWRDVGEGFRNDRDHGRVLG